MTISYAARNPACSTGMEGSASGPLLHSSTIMRPSVSSGSMQ